MDKQQLVFISNLIGMCQRANARSTDMTKSKPDRDFHAGRREGYLKALAMFMGCEVVDIREGVLGSTVPRRRPVVAIDPNCSFDEVFRWNTRG